MRTYITPKRSLRLVIRPGEEATKWSPRVQGKSVEFQDGIFKTQDQEVIDWMTAHAGYGSLFWESTDKVAMKDIGKALGTITKEGSIGDVLNSLSAEEMEKLSVVLAEKAVDKRNVVVKKEELGKDQKIAALEAQIAELTAVVMAGRATTAKVEAEDSEEDPFSEIDEDEDEEEEPVKPSNGKNKKK